jgi:hypothetical protein
MSSGTTERTGTLALRPDLFLSSTVKPAASVASPPPSTFQVGIDVPDSTLHVIGGVVAHPTHYRVSDAGTETQGPCANARILDLVPISDPVRYNMRRLWMNEATSQMCMVRAVWNGIARYRGKSLAVDVTLTLDADGRVVRWATDGPARAGLLGDSYEAEGTYTAFHNSEAPPPKP